MMNFIRIWQLLCCIFCLYCYSSFAAPNEGKLGSYNIDTAAISVSGFSSGGFMAVQLHVIESDTFMGAGVVAGGPYNCAHDSLSNSLTACMSSPYMIQAKSLIENAKAQADLGRISSLNNLYNSRLYLFSGKEDSIVKPGVMTKAQEFYEEFVNPANILTQYDIVAEHGFVTMNNGGACNRIYRTYINDCNYDSAYHLLNHIYGGNLEVPSYSSTAPAPRGTVFTYDQSEFINSLNPSSIGMDSKGYIFVPDSCTGATETCRLHVSIHGCEQGDSFIGDSYVMETGYNEVAALNNIIVIYPQASVIPISNPDGCWDFWGYTDSNYAYHNGKQVVAIMNMVKRLTSDSKTMTSSPAPTVITTSPTVVPTEASSIKTVEPKTTTKPESSIEDGVLELY
ncbi:poly(3-hydroxybutyrate) depolymerase-like isoform X2 [Styela clava]